MHIDRGDHIHLLVACSLEVPEQQEHEQVKTEGIAKIWNQEVHVKEEKKYRNTVDFSVCLEMTSLYSNIDTLA